MLVIAAEEQDGLNLRLNVDCGAIHVAVLSTVIQITSPQPFAREYH